MSPEQNTEENAQATPQVIQPQSPNVQTTETPEASQPAEPSQQQAPSTQPSQPQASVEQPQSTAPGGLSPKNSKKKKLVIAAVSAGVVLLLILGLVFGYYLPNRPENVWNRGLDRTGTAFAAFVENATKEEKLEEFSSSEIAASVEYIQGENEFKGNLDIRGDDKNSEGSLVIDLQSEDPSLSGKKFSLDFITEIPEGKTLPDSYFKYSGTNALGLDFFLPGISEFEGQWILVSSDYLKETWSTQEITGEENERLTPEEAVQLARVITDTTSEYVFTSDKSKAVLENREFVGTEEEDDLQTYRYKVGINKNHFQQYCETLGGRVVDEPAYKKLTGLSDESLEEEKKEVKENCKKAAEDIEEDETFDMWIDKKTDLIYKVRFEEKNGTVVEVGQKYNGDDKVTLFINTETETSSSRPGDPNINIPASTSKYESKTEIVVDMEASSVEGSMDITNHASDYGPGSTIKIGFSIKPYDGEVEIEAPDEFISIEELMRLFEESARSNSF